MENSVTKSTAKTAAGSKTSASKKTGTAGRTSARRKTSSAAKKPAAKTSNTVRLTAAETELLKNYRKCSAIEKKFINAVTEKAAGGMDFDSILGILKAFF